MFSSDTICYFNAGSSDTAELLGNYLSKILIKNGFSDIAPVLLCIGSDRVTGDSLGPMVGSALEERYKKSIPVFGTLKMPVHALNLEETIDAIHLHFPDHPLIAVDASFGTKEHLGCITAGKGSLTPGAGVDKNLIAVGDFFCNRNRSILFSVFTSGTAVNTAVCRDAARLADFPRDRSCH